MADLTYLNTTLTPMPSSGRKPLFEKGLPLGQANIQSTGSVSRINYTWINISSTYDWLNYIIHTTAPLCLYFVSYIPMIWSCTGHTLPNSVQTKRQRFSLLPRVLNHNSLNNILKGWFSNINVIIIKYSIIYSLLGCEGDYII